MSLTAAYGGAKWSARVKGFRDDLPEWWGDWGVSTECGTLQSVLLRRPGPELDAIEDFDAVQMRSDVLPVVERSQHDDLVAAYQHHGVVVHLVQSGRIDEHEAQQCLPMNFVALRPGAILMPSGGESARALYEEAGVLCHIVDIGELIKAGGGIHCITGFLKRDAVA